MQFHTKHVTAPVTQLKTCNRNMSLFMMNSVIPCTKQHKENKDEYCTCSVRLYLQLFVGGLMSYLRYFCLLAHNGVQHILC